MTSSRTASARAGSPLTPTRHVRRPWPARRATHRLARARYGSGAGAAGWRSCVAPIGAHCGEVVRAVLRHGHLVTGALRAAVAADTTGNAIPLLILRLNGQGPASIDDWPVVMKLSDFEDLVRD